MTTDETEAAELPPIIDAKAIIEGSLFGLLAINTNSTIVYANDGVERILGYTPAELVGDSLATLIPDRLQQAHFESFAEYQQTGERHVDWNHVEVPAIDANGDETPLAIAFREYHSESTDLYVGIFVDRTELEEREQELERHKEEMEFFNSLLRHDVLNAITIIRAHGAELVRELDGAEQEHAETIVEWSDSVAETIQRVRNMLETLTDETLELERVSLSMTLRQQVESVSKTYPDVEFTTEIPSEVYVQANALLADVFKNLLTNAVVHNEQERLRIEVSVEVEGDTVTVRIADNGVGIPDELKEEVFQRGGTGETSKKGSGFGLYFVNAMLTAYDGDIHIEDNKLGGATFIIELPSEQGMR